MPAELTVITRDIAPGEVFTHTGPVEVQGNIGDGAQLDIKKGGLHVKGSVGNQVYIETAAEGGSGSISGSNIICGSNIVMVNGRVISGDVYSSGSGGNNGPSGIEIDGAVGDNVVLKSKASIEVRGRAGAHLNAFALGKVELADTGDDLSSRAGGSFEADGLGARAQVTAGGSAHIGELGHGSRVTGGGSAKIKRAGHDCVITGGGSAEADTLGRNSILTGGGSARVELAHETALVNAGGSKRVRRTSADENDFALRSDTAPKPAAPAVQPPEEDTPKPSPPTIGLQFKL